MEGLRIARWGGPLERFEGPDPQPRSGEVLVEVEACGIGLTVVNAIRGDLGSDPALLPRVPGHELVGREVVTGARVVAYFYRFCGSCDFCRNGSEPLCARFDGYVSGGYATHAVLPRGNAILVGEIEAVEATVVPDAVATSVHVAARAHVTAADRVAVIGAGGGVGMHLVQVARLHGADVVGVDRAPEKLAFLETELGVRASEPYPALRADVVVDLVGSAESLAGSLRMLSRRGRLVLLTTFPDVTAEIEPRSVVFDELQVIGSRYATRAEVREAAELVREGRVRPIVGRRVGLDGVESVHAQLQAGTLLGRGALVHGITGSNSDDG